MSILKTTILAAAIATTFASAPGMAYQTGDLIARTGAAGVNYTCFSDGDTNNTLGSTGAKLEIDSSREFMASIGKKF